MSSAVANARETTGPLTSRMFAPASHFGAVMRGHSTAGLRGVFQHRLSPQQRLQFHRSDESRLGIIAGVRFAAAYPSLIQMDDHS
jgi:hypothetical protein